MSRNGTRVVLSDWIAFCLEYELLMPILINAEDKVAQG